MDTRKSLIVASLALLIILGIVFGTIFYFVRLFQARQNAANSNDIFATPSPGIISSTSSPNQSDFIFASPSPNATSSSGVGSSANASPNPDVKSYNGQSFQLKYPKNWGLLTCSNSQNFELDPTNSQDMLTTFCQTAIKPVTVLVDNSTGCGGETITLGGIQVQKSKNQTNSWTEYRWCTKTTPMLNITHRVSSENLPANSRDDYSRQVEQIISSLTFVRGGS